MNKLLLVVAFLLISVLAFGQSAFLSGTVSSAADNSTLPGASVVLTRLADSARVAQATDTEGNFRFNNLTAGEYQLRISFVGYTTQLRELTLPEEGLELGSLALKEDAEQLNEIEIIRQQPLATQEGDTTSFRANAFKTTPDANAEDLIRKMPGVVVQDGKVQAQGEEVRRVLVDGKPFFGDDPTAALKNLPAEIIDKIQVFDQQSEQARASGFDDGETTKTINIVTKPEMRNGQFGRVYSGYGLDGRYMAGGNLNIFNDDQRISILAQSNNINQQNFATEDLAGVASGSGRGGRGGRGGGGRGGFGGGGGAGEFMVGQQGGIATTNAVGINYTDQWGEKVEVSGSYFFNHSSLLSTQNTQLEYLGSRLGGQTYTEESKAESTNSNHRFNLRLDYNIDKNNSLQIRPRLSLQDYSGNSSLVGLTRLGSETLSSTINQFNSSYGALSFSNDLLYRHSFAKRGRTLSVNIGTSIDNRDGTSELNSQNEYLDESPVTENLLQQSDLQDKGWRLSADVRYTEPISQKSQLMLNYRTGYQYSRPYKLTTDLENDESEAELNPALSSQLTSSYRTNSLGGSYRLRSEKGMLMAGINYQASRLDNNLRFPLEGDIERTFENILPMAMYRHNFSKEKNLRVMYRTSANPPSAQRLLYAVDNSNPLQLTIGNPALRQDYQHTLFTRYSANNPEKASTFFALISGSYSAQYIGNSVLLPAQDTILATGFTVPAGVQLTQPQNLEGYWNMRTFVSYGVPVQLLKSNLNVNATASYSHIPGLINGAETYTGNTGFGAGVVLSSNISEKIDFTLSTQANYTIATNSLQESLNNRYMNQTSRASFKWILPFGLSLESDLAHQYYGSFAGSDAQNYMLLNAGIGKRMFNNRGELSLYAYDLLNQNTDIQRNITEAYIESVQTDVLNRYLMLRFTYNIRNFKNAGNM
ncbi:TonB-dependent receptor [Cesiribacter sp. SM1]|uniref:TonB-dependent receptor n=1 Tax=Cesiribacter sp. SM1 TaxID=2861196 RepID=UPI001CD51870|nr:TonB-dependent receptor [Cesiribacter sp. SM1]